VNIARALGFLLLFFLLGAIFSTFEENGIFLR
jgi:hypothetical protein